MVAIERMNEINTAKAQERKEKFQVFVSEIVKRGRWISPSDIMKTFRMLHGHAPNGRLANSIMADQGITKLRGAPARGRHFTRESRANPIPHVGSSPRIENLFTRQFERLSRITIIVTAMNEKVEALNQKLDDLLKMWK